MRKISLFFGAALLTACGGSPKPKPEPEAPAPVNEHEVLQFDHSGAAVYVGHNWKVSGSKFSKLGGAIEVTPIVSPRGKLAFVGPKSIHISKGARTDLPKMVSGAESTFGYWLDEDSLYLHQSANGKSGCRVFNVPKGFFKKPAKGCILGQFKQVTWLTGGPDNHVAVHTTNGTKNGVQIVKWSATGGQNSGPKAAKQAVEGEIREFFTKGGYAIVSACEFGGGACDAAASSLYMINDGVLGEKVATVAQGTAVNRKGTKLAWMKDGKICVGAPGSAGKCHTVPKSKH